MRLLQRPQRYRHVLVDEVLAPVGERVGRQAGADAVERVDEDVARVVVRDLVESELVGRDAAADADLEPAVAEMVEHADFLDHAQRRIERQQIDQRPEPHALGRARQRAEIDARNRHHVERRGVVLGDVQAVDAGGVGRLGELEALVEQQRERALAVLDMVEKSNLHRSPASCLG